MVLAAGFYHDYQAHNAWKVQVVNVVSLPYIYSVATIYGIVLCRLGFLDVSMRLSDWCSKHGG